MAAEAVAEELETIQAYLGDGRLASACTEMGAVVQWTIECPDGAGWDAAASVTVSCPAGYPEAGPDVLVDHPSWWVATALPRRLRLAAEQCPGCPVLYLLYSEAEQWCAAHPAVAFRALPAAALRRVLLALPPGDRRAACAALGAAPLVRRPGPETAADADDDPAPGPSDILGGAAAVEDLVACGVHPNDLLVLGQGQIRMTPAFRKFCRLTTLPVAVGDTRLALAVCLDLATLRRVLRIHNDAETCRLLPLAEAWAIRGRRHLRGLMPLELGRLSGPQLWDLIAARLIPQHLKYRVDFV